jgi:hypothetical protein
MEIPKINHMPQTHTEFLKWQVIQYNNTFREAKGYVCAACKNRRWFAYINGSGDFALKPCTCQNVIAAQRAEQSEKGKRK